VKKNAVVYSLIVFVLMCSGIASAEQSSDPATSAETKPAKGPTMFPAGLIGVLGGVSDSPSFVVAATPFDHTFAGIGLSFNYNGAGQPNASHSDISDKIASNLLLAAQYMVVDHHPFAMGPEFFISGSLSPDKLFSFLQVQPGWAFWYCPFKAPLAIGSALDIQVQIPTQHGQKPIINLLTPALRIGYIFNGI